MLNVLISYEMKLCGDVIGTTGTTQNGGRTGTPGGTDLERGYGDVRP